jgi:signal transduction histidine kinase
MRIRAKFISLLLFTSLVPLIVLALLLVIQIRSETQQQTESYFKTIIQNQGSHIERFLKERKGDIIALSENSIIKSPQTTTEEKLAEMKRIQNTYGVYDDITLIDTRGVVITSTDYNYRGEWLTNEWYKKAREGTVIISDAHVITNPYKVVLVFMTPVFGPEKEVLSVIAGQVDMKQIWSITDRTKIGKNGFIFMADKRGRIIAHPNKDNLFELSHTPKTCTHFTTDTDNHKTIEIYEPFLIETGEIDENCWFVVASEQKEEVFTTANTLMTQIIVIFSIAGLASLVFGRNMSRKIADPLVELAEQAYRIGRKNFEAKSSVKTGDEIEELSKALNATAAELKKIEQERKDIDEAKTQFLSITSHELRSPMTPMKGQLQQLLEGYFGKLTKEQKESLNIILRNTTRLEGVISDLLDMSKIESARLKFNYVQTSLVADIKKVLTEMEHYLTEKKIKIVANIGKLPMIKADPDRVGQVVRNLITNAKKYSPENTTIFVSAEAKEKEILITVKDSGYGISKSHQRRIFEPFFQAEQTIYRKQGGTGLGLVICKGIVESQGGKIWFESEEGKGTTFYFTVPFNPSKELKPIQFAFKHETTASLAEGVKKIYTDLLGPLGVTQFDKIKESLDESEIVKQIEGLQAKKVITKNEAWQFTEKIHRLFKSPEEEENKK